MEKTTAPDQSEAPSFEREAGTASKRLDRSLIVGIAWTGAAKWATQILRWASTLIVARLLTPADYGIVGMASVYLGFVRLISEFGIGAAIIQRRDLDEDQIARLGGFAVGFGVVLFGISVAAARPIGWFFNEPAVVPVILVLSLNFILSGVRTLPYSLLTRDLKFRALAAIDTIEAISLAGVTLAFAIMGFGYWALVVGMIVGTVVGTASALGWRRHRFAWPRRLRSIADALTFGFHVVTSRVAWYVYRNADFALVGRLFGKDLLGAYTLGWTIGGIPADRVHQLYQRVTPSIFAAVQQEAQTLGRYVRGITEAVALMTFPACIGIALVADLFTLVILGDHWASAIAPLRLLAAAGAIRSVDPLLAQVLIATGRTKENRNTMLLAAIVMPPLFFLGSRWGVEGVAWAWIIAYPLVVFPNQLRYTFRATRMNLCRYVAALWPALSSTALMAAAVLGTRALIGSRWALAAELSVAVAVGAAVYAGAMLSLHGQRIRAVRSVLRQIRR